MIHVVGNAGIDTIFRVDRFPLPGETLVARAMREDIGGKGANQAIVVSRAGAQVSLAAAIGDDDGGRRVRAVLASEGVLGDRLHIWTGATDRSAIYVDATGENTIVSATDAARAFDPAEAGLLGDIGPGDVVLCQGNLSVSALVKCLAFAKARGAATMLNASPSFDTRGFDWRIADSVIVNEVEAAGLSDGGDALRGAARLRAAGVSDVILTLGSKGAALIGSERIEVAATKVSTVDTTGAGDVFCGVLTAARAAGAPWRAALASAAEAAAIAVTRPGVYASFPMRGEIAAILSRHGVRTTP